MPSPFAETYTSLAAVPFAANVDSILLTNCINTEPAPIKIVRHHKDRKVVPRVPIKLPLIVPISKSILKPISKL